MLTKRMLLLLICAHLTILFLQLPIRGLVLDTTFWRDAVLLLTLGIWMAATLVNPHRFSLSGIDRAVIALFGYGALLMVVGSLTDGNLTDQVLDFRNYFLPLLIYFPARNAFSVPQHRLTYMRFLLVFFAVFLVSPPFEALYSLLNLPMQWIPWYSYTFSHDYRFLGNSDSAYIDPANSPILGLLGYPHYTAPVLVALFAFVFPLMGYRLPAVRGRGARALSALSGISQGVYLVFFAAVVLLLHVRTQIATALVILLILPSSRRVFKLMLYCAVALAAVTYWFPEQMTAVGQRIVAGVVSSGERTSSLDLILSVRELTFISSSPLRQLLFGHGLSFDAVASGQWELRLLYYTARLGLIWVILFLGLLVVVFRGVFRIRSKHDKASVEIRIAQGCFGMTVVYLLDSGHYMRLMAWPNLDLWIISVALLSSVLARTETDPKAGFPMTDGSTVTVPAGGNT